MAKKQVSLNIAKLYAIKIRKGEKTIYEVPVDYKTYVRILLEEKR